MLIVLTTTATSAGAAKLADLIVRSRLAACVQILPQIESVYVWDDKIQSDHEHLLLIKTLPEKFDELEALIVSNHTYDTPEIVAIESSRVGEKYLGWMSRVLT